MSVAHRVKPAASVAALAMWLTALVGCGQPYALRGTVVPGPGSSISVVKADHSRLASGGMPGASIEAVLDPSTLGRKILPATTSDAQGQFSIRVSEFGAGVLEYHVLLIVRMPGYAPARAEVRLPRAGQRVLVTLAPGRDRPVDRPDNIVDETLEQGRRLMEQ